MAPRGRLILLVAALVVVLLWCPGLAAADAAAQPRRYRCDDQVLVAALHRGAVDDLTIPNQADGTLPGAFVVLQSEALQLQLPRTNNAGAPSFTDGRWWWSLEDPDHPDFRQRLGLGTVEHYACEPLSAD